MKYQLGAVLTAIVVFGVLGYIIYGHVPVQSLAPGFPAVSDTAPENSPVPSVPIPPRTPPVGDAEYRNTTYRFSLFYPDNLAVKEYDEGGGGRTITFQDVKTAQGFQIFIVPYSARQVSTERFREDEPSGVMKNPANLSLDGVLATAFSSTNATLGDTREVWFIRGGYLYEVTAPAALTTWFDAIMQSWKFL